MNFDRLVEEARRRELLTRHAQSQRAESRAQEAEREADSRLRAKWSPLVAIWMSVADSLVAKSPPPDARVLDRDGADRYLALRREHEAKDTRPRWYEFETAGEPSGNQYRYRPSRRETARRADAVERVFETHAFAVWDMFLDSSASNTAGYSGARLYMGADRRIYFGLHAFHGSPPYGWREYDGLSPTEALRAGNALAPRTAQAPQGIDYEEVSVGLANLVAKHNLRL